jgi:dihydropyrimidine dehydrogenase (NAD+) subunit PreA
VGQVPEYCEQITGWVMQVAGSGDCEAHNITNIVAPARAAVKARANALSLINTVNSSRLSISTR